MQTRIMVAIIVVIVIVAIALAVGLNSGYFSNSSTGTVDEICTVGKLHALLSVQSKQPYILHLH